MNFSRDSGVMFRAPPVVFRSRLGNCPRKALTTALMAGLVEGSGPHSSTDWGGKALALVAGRPCPDGAQARPATPIKAAPPARTACRRVHRRFSIAPPSNQDGVPQDVRRPLC